jgi:hypothetical protein
MPSDPQQNHPNQSDIKEYNPQKYLNHTLGGVQAVIS